jgi:hypothetical protein
MWEDPIVNEVRKIRKELEAKFDFDAKSIFKDIRKRQALLGSRLIDRKKKIVAEKVVAPDRDSATPHPGR